MAMDRDEFISLAMASGFTRSQADFMDNWLAKHPHQHEIEDVDGLPESLEELGLSEVVEDDDEVEEEEEDELK